MVGASQQLKVFVCGDVMLGRGLDQIMRCPSDPKIFEPFVKDARDYVALAEFKNGIIPRSVNAAYVWGDALNILDDEAPDVRIINLETSITTSDTYWRGKAINYRMHPRNVDCLNAAGVDCCILANNHVLDWGYSGLADTIAELRHVGIRYVGAGSDMEAAAKPAVLTADHKGRIEVFAWASPTAGVPANWQATSSLAGVNYLSDLSTETIAHLRDAVESRRSLGVVMIASLHWGENWGYEITAEQRYFARALIDELGFHVIHGHSSHHPKAIEIYHGQPILYGCGDFLNDYEGIGGFEEYRGDLTAMYFIELDPLTKKLQQIRIYPLRICRMRLQAATSSEGVWLLNQLTRECSKFNTPVHRGNGVAFVI